MRLHKAGIGFLAGLMVLFLLGRADTALASTGPGNYYHVYSVATWHDGTAATNIYFQTENVPINVSDGNDMYQGYRGEGGHIDPEYWIFTQNQSYSTWAEAGIDYNDYNNCYGYSSCFWIFWADGQNGGQCSSCQHFLTTVPMNNATQTWEIYESSYNNWYIDSNTYGYLGLSTHQSGVYSWAWQTGIEEYDGDSDYYQSNSCCGAALVDPDESTSGTFNNYIEVWNGSSWHYPGGTLGQIGSGGGYGYGCGPNPNGYCMNGTSYGNGEWSANIP